MSTHHERQRPPVPHRGRHEAAQVRLQEPAREQACQVVGGGERGQPLVALAQAVLELPRAQRRSRADDGLDRGHGLAQPVERAALEPLAYRLLGEVLAQEHHRGARQVGVGLEGVEQLERPARQRDVHQGHLMWRPVQQLERFPRVQGFVDREALGLQRDAQRAPHLL
jgi:hypothetical protein